MDRFTIRGDDGFITVSVTRIVGADVPAYGGGNVFAGNIEIQRGAFRASGEILYTSSEVARFYKSLQRCQETLEGEALFAPQGESCEVYVGIKKVRGCYRDHPASPTELIFEFPCDQTYFQATLEELKGFLQLFGG